MVEELLQEKDPWSDKLVELTQCLPLYGAWMDSVTVERQMASASQRAAGGAGSMPVMVHILGRTTSVNKTSQFVASLEDSGTFGDIVFDSTISGVDSVVGDTVMKFKLSVALSTSGGEL